MIETTSRPDRTRQDRQRHDQATTEPGERLFRLSGEAHAEPREEDVELPPDQRWVDVSMDPPDPPDPPPSDPWWRSGRVGRLAADWIPEVSAGGRRRLAIVLAGGLVFAVAVALWMVTSSRGVEHETPPVLPVAAASQAPSAAAEASIVVSVVGNVTSPGLVTLPDGARVADALRAAGGPVPDADLGALNLARRLTDGEQIYVGVPAPPGAEQPPAAPGVPGVADKVDLNMATLAALDTLPGVGPVTAQRIVDWRTEHGRFDSVEQLREIDGIGPSRFARLKDLVVAR
ncbi:ComEA family DNA-binding protein [Actinophytocola sp.]|uniref:ComEA family DNA-binding protein n=1 Tax=Actinophytocola sp. TaxID=1872138 RepID=UPI002D5C978A|nr:ComEA family DNA-binding protein [Actinophytocola sp.]HYQ66681.1 ComEA family DNA-binding protein [Actinophytocola sp.]